MVYLNIEQLKDLNDGKNFMRQIGSRTPEELAEDIDQDPAHIRKCLSLARKMKNESYTDI